MKKKLKPLILDAVAEEKRLEPTVTRPAYQTTTCGSVYEVITEGPTMEWLRTKPSSTTWNGEQKPSAPHRILQSEIDKLISFGLLKKIR